jgi:hypothetical protein
MNSKEIEEEAEKRADQYSLDGQYANGYENGFIAGVNWIQDKLLSLSKDQPQQKEIEKEAERVAKSYSNNDSARYYDVYNIFMKGANFVNQPQQKEGELLSELKDELISIDDRHYTWNDAKPSVLRLINKLNQPQQKES